MSMACEVVRVTGRPGPERALMFMCRFRWYDNPGFLISLSGQVLCGNKVLSDLLTPDRSNWDTNFQSRETPLQREREFHGSLIAPLSIEAIKLIENSRNDADVSLQLNLFYNWQSRVADINAGMGAILWDRTAIGAVIARSDWLRHLTEMEWSDTVLFEVATLPIAEDRNLTEALKLLNEAQTAMRMSDYKGVLVKCREALESAAKYEAQGDLKKGFELLLNRAFPEHESKRESMNLIIESISKYFHLLGRHAQYPALSVSRGEAEFAFTTSISLFSLITRRLAKKETV